MEAWKQLLVQLAGATAVVAFALIVMGFAFFVIKVTMGLRVDKKVEIEGLDHEEHGLSSAYGDFVLSDYSDIINNDAVKGENSEDGVRFIIYRKVKKQRKKKENAWVKNKGEKA